VRAFRYNLQALLSLREGFERKALEHYSQALAERAAALARLDDVRGAQQESWFRWKAEIADGCSAAAIAQWHACSRKLDELRVAAEAEVKRASSAADESLRKMLLAKRDREAVANHRKRQRAGYLKETDRCQQNELDDLAQRRCAGAAARTESATPV
jgi:flagellar export protein FliJ